MAQCRFCNRYIPDGVMQCPHCQASLQASAAAGGEVISPFEVRARALLERQQLSARRAAGGLPASRLALFGCLGLIILVVLAAGAFYLVAPDKALTLIYGTPTLPPPTRRPTPTPAPTPSPTPEWPQHEGADGDFAVDFPPIWVVVDYSDPYWEKILLHKAHWYSWLTRELPEDKRLAEAEVGGIRAFDIRRLGYSSVYCYTDPALAGVTTNWIRTRIGQRLLSQGHEDVRAYEVKVDERDAILFEYLTEPEEESPGDQAFKTKLYVLADERQGYWIQITGLEKELAQDARIVQAVVDSFEILTPQRQRDD